MRFPRPQRARTYLADSPGQSARPVTIVSCAALLTLFGCAHADNPEQFRADTTMLNDFTMALPSHGSSAGFNYEIIQGLAVFEGDIILGEVDQEGKLTRKIQPRGLTLDDPFGRWPDGIVPYLAPENNSPTQRANINDAIQHWMERTRITFVERTAENADQYPHYLRFDSTAGSCASHVGMIGGEQQIRVSDACSTGSIVHEIGHALGLFHEHTRSDRDNFVQIDWDQVVKDKTINFELQNAGTLNIGPYDYGSIMHYGEYFFSATGMPTIIIPDGVEIGQRDALSELDAASVDTMYATDLALLPPNSTETEQGLELDVTVLNQGNLGAHDLTLSVKVSNDTQWQGISRESGWQCMTYETELRCDRDTLAEKTESRFTLLLDPGSGTLNDVSMLLAARTMDTSPGNNSYNDDGTLNPDQNISVVEDSTNDTSTLIGTTDTTSNTTAYPPEIRAAKSASNDASAAGSDNGSLLLLALSLIGWRRYRLR